jgi:hypothetical protein
MKKQFTLVVTAIALICAPAWSQVANVVTQNDDANDSLRGFNAQSALDVAAREHLSPTETAGYLAGQKKIFIAKRYDLNGYNEKNGMIGTMTPQSGCTNMGFENGDFSGWQGAIGDNTSSSLGPLQNIQVGIFSTTVDAPTSDMNARHTICSAASGNDPCGGFPIVPAGYGNYVARIGTTYAQYQGEILEQTFVVSATNTQFTYRYAAVLNDGGHLLGEQPYFRIDVLDSLGNPVSPCAQYYVEAGGSVPGFIQSQTCPSVYYKPWSPVTVDLSAYINRSVTVRFTAGGCIYSGHYAYAYIDCSCANIGESVSAYFCPGSNGAFLIAPGGFGAYQWYDPHGNAIPGATNDSLFANSAAANDTFSVVMTYLSDTSCHSTVSVIVNLTPVLTAPTFTNPTCYGFTDGSATQNCTNCFPPTTYTWTTSPVQTTQTASNLGAGTYMVTVVDSIGCTDIDTIVLAQPPQNDTSGIKYQFCYGDPTITLNGIPGMPSYQWYDGNMVLLPGETGQQFVVTSPGLNQLWYVIYGTFPCPIKDSIFVNYIPPAPLFSPDSLVNVFTPNGDGKNDYFYPYFDYSVANQTAAPGGAQPAYDFHDMYVGTYEVWVYDRWGKEVFYSNDYTFGWDGKFNNNPATAGVYYWISKYTSRCKLDMEPITTTGFVHLIR